MTASTSTTPAGGGARPVRATGLRRLLAVSLIVAGVLLATVTLLARGSSSPAAPAHLPVALVASGPAFVDRDARDVLLLDRTLALLGRPGLTAVHRETGLGTGEPTLGQLVLEDLPGGQFGLVVVQAGETDARSTTASVREGAEQLVAQLRRRLPAEASFVLVGPALPTTGEPAYDTLRARDILEDVARRERVPFVDPVDLGWRAGDDDLANDLAESVRPFLPAG